MLHASRLIMLAMQYKTLGYGVLLLFVTILLVSCGEPVGGSSKSPVFLVASTPPDQWGAIVDVYTPGAPGGVTDEFFNITINSIYKGANPATQTEFAEVIIQEYRVTYYRIDGNPNVPDPIEFHLGASLPAGSSVTINVLFLRRDAKLKSPLKELVFGGGEGAIEMNALIEFFGEDLMGNHLSTNVVLDMTVSDY
jgi:hypothetical protein